MNAPESRPPFTAETAAQKVRKAEDGCNSRDPVAVSLAYTPDTIWRNRAEFPVGRNRWWPSSPANGKKNWNTA